MVRPIAIERVGELGWGWGGGGGPRDGGGGEGEREGEEVSPLKI